MTTKTKQELSGPKLSKAQRAEALEFWAELSAPRAESSAINDITALIELSALSNEDIDKLVTQLKALRTKSSRTGPVTGVGARCKALIKSGLGNKDVLTQVKAEFPQNNTTYSCIAWYRNDMRQKGEL
jgi:hypothetical protein